MKSISWDFKCVASQNNSNQTQIIAFISGFWKSLLSMGETLQLFDKPNGREILFAHPRVKLELRLFMEGQFNLFFCLVTIFVPQARSRDCHQISC